MRKFLLLAIIATLILITPLCYSLPAPSKEKFIPTEQYLSPNSSFIVIANPNTNERPIRMLWSVYNTGNYGIGSFQQVGNKFICYFSNTDPNATCGPSPFTESGSTQMYIYSITSDEIANNTVDLGINTMNLDIRNVILDSETNILYINFYMNHIDSLKYSVYNDNFDPKQVNAQLVFSPTPYPGYFKNITLQPGTYYIAFEADDNGNRGSNLVRVYIPKEDYLTINTDKDQYWLGGDVKISGTSSASSVNIKIKYPNSSVAKTFDVDVNNNLFSYNFTTPSYWSGGQYSVMAQVEDLSKSASFSLSKLLEATPSSVTFSINKSRDFAGTVKIENKGDEFVNLSLEVQGDVKRDNVGLKKYVLSPQGSTDLNINITNVQENINGKVILKTNLSTITEIPVSISVSGEACPQCPDCPVCPICTGGKNLQISPLTFIKNCLIDEEISNSFTIRNAGDSQLTSLSYEIEDASETDNSLENLNDFSIPSLSTITLAKGESKTIDIDITPADKGSYKGIVKIKGKSGEELAYVFVDLNCFEDMTSEIASLKSDLDKLSNKISSGMYDDIKQQLDDAQYYLGNENYAEANNKLQQAKAEIDLIKSSSGGINPTPGGGLDITTIAIIVVVILVIVFVLWWFFIKRKKLGPSEGEEVYENEGGREEVEY